MRLAGDITGTRGFNDNLTLNTDDGDREEAVTARAKLLLTPEALPGFDAHFNFTYIDTESGEIRIVFEDFPERRVSRQNVEER